MAKKGKKKNTEYQKQKKRVKALKTSMEKRGFFFPDVSFTERLSKAFDKATSTATRFLKGLTPRKMQEKSLYVDVETGEVISGVAGRRKERQKAYEKGREPKPVHTPPGPGPEPLALPAAPQPPKPPEPGPEPIPEYGDEVLMVIENLINTWSPSTIWSDTLETLKMADKNVALNILEGAIMDLGRERVARNAQDNARQIIYILDQILYASGSKNVTGRVGQQQNLADFAALIRGGALTKEEAQRIEDAINAERYEDEV